MHTCECRGLYVDPVRVGAPWGRTHRLSVEQEGAGEGRQWGAWGQPPSTERETGVLGSRAG